MQRLMYAVASLALTLCALAIGCSNSYSNTGLSTKEVHNRSEIAVVNRAMQRSFDDPAWVPVALEILHHQRCQLINPRRAECAYSYSFKRDDNGSITHIESGKLIITPKRDIFVKATGSRAKRRGT